MNRLKKLASLLFYIFAALIIVGCSNLFQNGKTFLQVNFSFPITNYSRTTTTANWTWAVKIWIEQSNGDVLQTVEKTVNNEKNVSIYLNNVLVGKKIRVCAELTSVDGLTFEGSSSWFTTKTEEKKILLDLTRKDNETNEPQNPTIPENPKNPTDPEPGNTYELEINRIQTKDGGDVQENASWDSTSGTVSITTPTRSVDVYTYCLISEDFTFVNGKNYKVEVDLSSKETTVVGIAAARADMFFTVGTEIKTYSFETGCLNADLLKGITIGTALSEETIVKNLKITEIADSNLPTLSFNISNNGIQEYLNGDNNSSPIIDITKTENGYKFGLNSTGVTLEIRDYVDESGLNKASFNMTSDSIGDASFLAKVEDSKINVWSSEKTNISDSSQEYSILFPATKENQECVVRILSESTGTGTLSISDFNVEKVDSNSVENEMKTAGKVFAIKTQSFEENEVSDTWKIAQKLPFSVEATIPAGQSMVFDVLLIDAFETVSEINWNDCTRFLYDTNDEKNIIDDKLKYTHSRDSNVDTFKIENITDNEVSCSITLTENFTVEINE